MTMESLKQRWDEWVISLKNKKGGASGGSIKSAQIVYVFGPMGTGKVCRCTFSCICLVYYRDMSLTYSSFASYMAVVYWGLHDGDA